MLGPNCTMKKLVCPATPLLLMNPMSSGAGRTGCWHEYKSLRKHGINFISKPIAKLDHRCEGKMFSFNFVRIVVVQNS